MPWEKKMAAATEFFSYAGNPTNIIWFRLFALVDDDSQRASGGVLKNQCVRF